GAFFLRRAVAVAAILRWSYHAAGNGGIRMANGLILDGELLDLIVQERKRKGIDLYDEVWDGTYVIPSPPTLLQQKLVGDLGDVLREVVRSSGGGQTYPGVNVSDRRKH